MAQISKANQLKNNPKFNISQAPRIKTLTRAKKEEFGTVKAELKTNLEALTPIGVKRYRIPYHQFVLEELEESKFQESVAFLKMLYKKDDEFEKTEKIKKLKNQKHLIEKVKIGLTKAELAGRNNKKINQSKHLLDIALFFQSLTPEWHWIANEFFKSTLKTSLTISEDEGELMNTIKYAYGKFLFYHIKNARSALMLLKEATDASKGNHWNPSQILNTDQKSLFKECNAVLCDVLIVLSKESTDDTKNVAMNNLLGALEKAKDSGDERQITRALFKLARVQMSSGNIKEALHNLLKYLARVKRMSDVGGICDAYRELAFVYKALKDTNGVMRHLELYKESAETSDLADRLAEAHYCLGEYLLEQKKPTLATPHLVFAFDCYMNLGMMEQMDAARFLAGISKGEELKDLYLDLVSNCQQNDPEALKKLLAWKNKRMPFWND